MTDTPPAPAAAYRPSLSLIRALTMFFVLGIVLDAVTGCLSLIEAAVFPGFAASEKIESAPEAFFAIATAVAALLAVLVFLTTAVLYCVWIYRANQNARALGASEMRFTPGWSVGWFFIPILYLIRPYQAVKEIYRASDPDAEPGAWKDVRVPRVLAWWWGLWILSTFMSQLEFRMSLNKNPGIAALSPWAGAAASLVDIPTAILALMVVRAIHARQQEKARRRAGLNPDVQSL